MSDLKPILAGIFGTVIQFTDLELFIKIGVGAVTFVYVLTKLFLLVLRNKDKLMHPFKTWNKSDHE